MSSLCELLVLRQIFESHIFYFYEILKSWSFHIKSSDSGKLFLLLFVLFLCCFICEINFKNCCSTSQKLQIDSLHRCPLTDRRMRKSWHFCAIEFYSAMKKIEIITFFWTRMELDILTLSDLIPLSLFFYFFY